jgi:hypothetical protein
MLWENYVNGELRITQSIWHGHVTAPKPPQKQGDHPDNCSACKSPGTSSRTLGRATSGPMFPNDAGNPMDLNNLVNRVIVPSLSRCADLPQTQRRTRFG